MSPEYGRAGTPPIPARKSPVPDEFDETVQRKADLFDALVAIVREPARPMGLSRHEFERWLPQALDVLANADAIVGSPCQHDPGVL
jgi:hypothetical protein